MRKTFTSLIRRAPAAAALALLLGSTARSAEIGAVLSAPSGPYAEAYSAFKAALDLPHEVYDASKPGFNPAEAGDFTVAFGARAAAADYPPGIHGISLLAPSPVRRHGWHQVAMVPSPAAAIAGFRKLQPGLKRLAVFWAAYPGEAYLEDLRKAGSGAGVEIISARLRSPDSFPERLRGLLGRMDAFWLMPDPALITADSLLVLGSFACANAVPFYAPTAALLQNGGAAALAPDFAQAGAAAAAAVKAVRAGESVPAMIFVEDIQLRINQELADKCRWPLKK